MSENAKVPAGLSIRLCQLGVLGIFLGFWELASRLSWVDPEILPPFSQVMVTLFSLIQNGSILNDLGVTSLEVVVAFIFAVPLGLVVGFIIGESDRLYGMAVPLLQLLMAIPKAIFLPMFVVAFGIQFSEKVVFAAVVASFVLILSGITTVRSVPAGLIRLARANGATRFQMYRHIYLPAMAPLIIEGMRIGLIFTIFGVLLSEMYGAQKGIGKVIFGDGEAFLMSPYLACTLLVVVITIVLNEVLRGIEEYSRNPKRKS